MRVAQQAASGKFARHRENKKEPAAANWSASPELFAAATAAASSGIRYIAAFAELPGGGDRQSSGEQTQTHRKALALSLRRLCLLSHRSSSSSSPELEARGFAAAGGDAATDGKAVSGLRGATNN